MKRFFDYYYVLLRLFGLSYYGKDTLSYIASGRMSLALTLNICSIILLFNRRIFWELDLLWLLAVPVILNLILSCVIDGIYNKKRRAILMEKYKNENPKCRRRGTVWVVSYEIFSLVFMIFSISLIEKVS